MTNSEIKNILNDMCDETSLQFELKNIDFDNDCLEVFKASSEEFFVGFKSDGTSRHYRFDDALIAITNQIK